VYKKFYRDIEGLLREIDSSSSNAQMLRTTLERIVESCSEEYGIESGRLYRERPTVFELIASVGEYGESITGKKVPKEYPIIDALQRERFLMISEDTPGFDPQIEHQFTHLDYAAIIVGRTPEFIMSFGVRKRDDEGHLQFVLETIRTAIDIKLRQTALESQLRQARDIQQSLLPLHLPKLPGYDLAAVSIPAEDVGGDIYDAQELEDGGLSVTVADASGHGLPAALQARDALTGLRMGIANDRKINVTIENLNNVINQSGLSSRFVSLFYGELEETGNMVFVNCGHCPPLLFTRNEDKVFELPSSGPVLGPLPDARYRRSFAMIFPGEVLVLFSDGIIERKAPGGQEDDDEINEYGIERLIAAVRPRMNLPAQEILDHVMEEVLEFGGRVPWEDDVTLFVISRLAVTENGSELKSGTVPVNLRLPVPNP